MSDVHVVLDCGCGVVVRQEWDQPICDCCSPADPYLSGGEITSFCAKHEPDDQAEWCPYDCSHCHDEGCGCDNCVGEESHE